VTIPHRVLVVDDHEPFRRILCALLDRRADLLIVGAAADGPDAIREAEALQPDLVLLDLGLPTLSGVEVAGRIRAVAPNARLLLVTNETSLDVVEEAFRRGADGYVYKPRAYRDVLRVIDAILAGGRFSNGLERIARGDSLASHRHDVLFYSSDAVLVNACSRFIAAALHEGAAVVALMRMSHGESLRRSLQGSKVDVELAIRQRRYVALNIDELLWTVMVNGWPDPARFRDAAEDVVSEAARHATGQQARVVAFGECAPTLWARGHVDAAIQLEHLWDELVIRHRMDTLCVYPVDVRQQDARVVRSLCAEHTAVEVR
jgi:DNA-binding NarL/FixJ family response regulator